MATNTAGAEAARRATSYSTWGTMLGALLMVGNAVIAFGMFAPQDCGAFSCETDVGAALILFLGLTLATALVTLPILGISHILRAQAALLGYTPPAHVPLTPAAAAAEEPADDEWTTDPTAGPATSAVLIDDEAGRHLVLLASGKLVGVEPVADAAAALEHLQTIHLGTVHGREPDEDESHLMHRGTLHRVVRVYDLR
jgi:hypothetical protein